MVSVNAADSVIATVLGLPSVSVSVALPPTAMVDGHDRLAERRRDRGDGQAARWPAAALPVLVVNVPVCWSPCPAWTT